MGFGTNQLGPTLVEAHKHCYTKLKLDFQNGYDLCESLAMLHKPRDGNRDQMNLAKKWCVEENIRS